VGARFGLTATAGRQPLSQILGTIVYVLVLIPIAITALDALQIQAISAPAIDMLNQILSILPKLFAAAVVLALAYVGGQYISDIVTNILTSIGFNNVFEWLGLTSLSRPPSEPTIKEVIEVAPNIVNLAFGLLAGGIAAAIAIGSQVRQKAMRQAIAQRLRRKYFQAMRDRDFSLGIDSVVTLDVW
jgi:hypothetical protein